MEERKVRERGGYAILNGSELMNQGGLKAEDYDYVMNCACRCKIVWAFVLASYVGGNINSILSCDARDKGKL